ncbi:MAG: elongation factor G [Spirochaetes bacterium]|nr:elongation factor G [Spirochaetota bacterium]
MAHDTKNIRNVSLVGHGQTGKTSLLEAMLFTAHVIPHMGKVDEGKTVSDYREQEISKKMSVHSSIGHLDWNDTLINIIDTPGIADFTGDVAASMRACDAAIFLMSADAGLEIETLKIWRKCQLPRMVFINKMDKEHADYENCLTSLKENFKDMTFVPLSMPIGHGKDFKGVVDLIDGEARYFEDGGKKIRKEPAPADMEHFEEHRTEMIETAVETDEELMNKYFNGEALSHDEIIIGLKKAIVQGKIVPVLCGEALENAGTFLLLDALVNYMPSPSDVGSIAASDNDGKEIMVNPSMDESTALFVFKTSIDQFAGKLSYFRVRRGTVSSDSELFCPAANKKMKCGKIFKIVGKTLTEVPKLNAGDIGAFAKLDDVHTNNTLSDPQNIIKLTQMELPQPIYNLAISCPNKKDEEKLIALLQKETEEDPTFQIEYNAETRENVISGMGETQIKFILDKLKEKNKIETETRMPRIAYRETIRKKASAEYTHKKQSGGHGQYARVAIDVKPIEEGQQYLFENAIVGGAIGKGYIPGCEKGFHEAMENGVVAGFKVVDVGIRLFDGKEHPVDSSEMAFKLASRSAFKEAMKQAGPVLLEPVYELSVYTEQKFVGDILSDISSKRGRVLGQDSLAGGIEIIKALVPLKELQKYSIDLKQITSGTGSFEIQFNNYQQITGKIADEVITEAAKFNEEE